MTTTIAFADQLAKLTPNIRKIALRFCKDEEDAYDLAQDAIVHALQNENRYAAGTNLEAWIFIVTKNLFINQYRKKQKRGEMVPIGELSEGARPLNEHADENEGPTNLYFEEINRNINRLPDTIKPLLVDRIDGYSYREIASKHEVTLEQVRCRIHRSRSTLSYLDKTGVMDRRRRNPKPSSIQRYNAVLDKLQKLPADNYEKVFTADIGRDVGCTATTISEILRVLHYNGHLLVQTRRGNACRSYQKKASLDGLTGMGLYELLCVHWQVSRKTIKIQ